MLGNNLIKGALCGAAAAALVALSASVAGAATYRFTEIVEVNGPTLVDSTTTIIKENGKTYEETVKKFSTETVTKTTEKTSRTVYEYNNKNYNHRIATRFRNTSTKWYNGYLSEDSNLSGGTKWLAWGKGSNGPSSYRMTSTDRYNASTGRVVRLGQFTHDNKTIKGGITNTVLDTLVTLDLDSGASRQFSFSFDIKHVETWNWGQNVADTVKISDERFNRFFSDGDTEYYFSLLGFNNPGTLQYNQDLKVYEGKWRTIDLLAKLTTKTKKTIWDEKSWLTSEYKHTYETMRMEISPVPLPAAAPLLMGALGGLVLLRRRRKS